MKPSIKYGLIIGFAALVVNIFVGLILGICAPFISLAAGAVAAYLAIEEEKPDTQGAGGMQGLIAGGITGLLSMTGMLCIALVGLVFLVPMAAMSADAEEAAGLLMITGLMGGFTFVFVAAGVIAGALAGAATGFLATPSIPRSTQPWQ
jgi:hypothetical protein